MKNRAVTKDRRLAPSLRVAFLACGALLLPSAVHALDWDASQCAAFAGNQADWGNYPESELAEILRYCEPLLMGMEPPPVEAMPQEPIVEALPVEQMPPEMIVDTPVDMPPAEMPFDPGTVVEPAPPALALEDWDVARCEAYSADPNAPAAYSAEDATQIFWHCDALLAAQTHFDGPPLEEPPPDSGFAEEMPPIETMPAPLSLAEWDVPRCEAFFADPNAGSLYAAEDFNQIVPYCQSIMAVAIPQADPALPPADALPPQDPTIAGGELMPDPSVDPSLAGEEVLPDPALDAGMGTGELMPPPGDAAAEGELLPDPAAGLAAEPGTDDLLPPVDAAAAEGELLPPPSLGDAVGAEAEVGGELLPPPADDPSLLPPAETAGAAPAEIDVAGLPPVASEGEPVVLLAISNATTAPLDVFVMPLAGGEPMYVATVEPRYSIVQPTNANRQWFLAQNDEWLGNLVTTAEPRQILKYEGNP